jgi:hypothetical protein
MAESSMIGGSFVGSKTLVANFFGQGGKTLRITARGYVGDYHPLSEIKLKFGSTVIWTSGSHELANGCVWTLDAIITCYTTGATGTVRPAVFFCYVDTGSYAIQGENGVDADVVIDTTAAQTIDLVLDTAEDSWDIWCTHFIWEALD